MLDAVERLLSRLANRSRIFHSRLLPQLLTAAEPALGNEPNRAAYPTMYVIGACKMTETQLRQPSRKRRREPRGACVEIEMLLGSSLRPQRVYRGPKGISWALAGFGERALDNCGNRTAGSV